MDGREIATYLTRTADFRKKTERKQSFEVYFELHRKQRELPLDFALRMGWKDTVYRMMAFDYLILNRDRHGANIEVLVDEKENARLAPLFDHGASLLFSCYEDGTLIRKFDVLEDRPVQSFTGSRSLEFNLHLLPKGRTIFPGKLLDSDRERLLDGLDQVLSAEHLDKIWSMIRKRWDHFVQVCDQK